MESQRLEELLQREIELRKSLEEAASSERSSRELLEVARSKVMLALSDCELEKARMQQQNDSLSMLASCE